MSLECKLKDYKSFLNTRRKGARKQTQEDEEKDK
jgi:hypothetical protein